MVKFRLLCLKFRWIYLRCTLIFFETRTPICMWRQCSTAFVQAGLFFIREFVKFEIFVREFVNNSFYTFLIFISYKITFMETRHSSVIRGGLDSTCVKSPYRRLWRMSWLNDTSENWINDPNIYPNTMLESPWRGFYEDSWKKPISTISMPMPTFQNLYTEKESPGRWNFIEETRFSVKT